MNENNFPMMDIQNIREQEGEVKVFGLNEFQELSKRTMPEPSPKELVNYSLGYVCEAAEFGDEVKKHVFHGHPLNRDKALKELGDGLHYLAGCATMLGLTLEEVATANIDKLMRRYPSGFSKEASIARVDVNE